MSTRLIGLVVIALIGAACSGGDEVVVSQGPTETSPTDIPAEPSSEVGESSDTTDPSGASRSTPASAFGRSTAGTAEQRRVEEAAYFRLGILNQTGQQHLSLSDYAAIRDDACGGAVNDPDDLVVLSRRWGLGLWSRDEQGANAIWLSAVNTCPEAFDKRDFIPFASTGGGAPESSGEAPSGAQVSFVDVSILDDPQWRFSGEQSILAATAALSAEDTVEHFRGAFSEGWTVNEVLGPVKDQNGNSRFWTLDVSGDGFSGVVEVHDSQSGVFVVIAVIDGLYPLPEFAVDSTPAIDGELDCLTDFVWMSHGDFGPDATGSENPEEPLEAFLGKYQERFGLGPVVHVRSGVGSLTVDGREVIVATATRAPAGGFLASSVRTCEPYAFEQAGDN